MNKKIAIVTGGTSGIGKATALALRGAGYTVYEFSRREAVVEGLHHIRADITDETQVRAAVQQVMDAEGQIDVVVNNAGFGISGAVEFTDTADAQRLFNADFFGMVRVNRAVIAHMRAAGRGRIGGGPGGRGCHERKAGFMIKRACLGNNRQLYFHICKIYREGGQRRIAALLVWRREGWREDIPRTAYAAMRRKPSGGIMRVKNGFIIGRK